LLQTGTGPADHVVDPAENLNRTAGFPGGIQHPPATMTALGDRPLRNGNFEQGNKEFRTAYKHSPGSVPDALTCDVVKDPNTVYRDAASFGDHTSGKGNMLVEGTDAIRSHSAPRWSRAAGSPRTA
jgi:hypothetical protein